MATRRQRWKIFANSACVRLAATTCAMLALLAVACNAQPPPQQQQQQQQGRVPPSDIDALLSLASLFSSNNWHPDTDPCRTNWTGVTCSPDSSQVIEIDLHSSALNGPIPPQLGNLPSLLSLNLSHNQLVGIIPPEISHLLALQHLDLSHNNLNGPVPPSLASLVNLQSLDLADNLLDGITLPSIFPALHSLLTLDLSNNLLTGTIPQGISNSTNLTHLDLSHNSLSGPLPQQVGSLPNLRTLDLSSNHLSGDIPRQLSSASSDPQSNSRTALDLSLVQQQQQQAPLGALFSLVTLNLSSNNLSKVIPPDLATLTSLQTLDLSANFLVGPVPRELGNLPLLTTLKLSSNFLAGRIPSELSHLDHLSLLDLSSNGLSGPIPASLCNARSLASLSLASNQLFGTIPPTLTLLPNLTLLDLSANMLEAPVPPEIGSLTLLRSLDLSSNNLNGSLPEELLALANLSYLNLSRNWLSDSVGGRSLSNLPKSLVVADLSGNGLGGEIPDVIGDLAGLQMLNLSWNGIGGRIPPVMGSLPRLERLDLSHNRLMGEVPPTVWVVGALFVTDNLLQGGVLSSTADVRNNCFSGQYAVDQIGAAECRKVTSWGLHRSSLRLSVAAIVAIVLGVGMFVKIVLFVVWWFCRRNRKKMSGRTIIPDAGVKSYLLSEMRLATDDFSKKNMLGEGGFGDVYKGTLPDGSLVAVKKLRIFTTEGEKEFLNEVKVISTVHNRNVVPLLGYTVEDDEYILVFPFMSRGSLEDALFGESYPLRLGWSQLAAILQGVSQGLAYLHERCVQKIVHRDIKAANILLDESFQAYVADFGLARAMEVEQKQARTKVAGTIGYIAPEYVRTGQLTEKSDVYSFGMLVLVAISNMSPTESQSGQPHLLKHAYNLAMEGYALRIVSPFFHPELPPIKDQIHRFLSVAFWCLQEEPTDRPTMGEVEQMLFGKAPVPLIHLHPDTDVILEASMLKEERCKPLDTSSETSIRVAPSPCADWSNSP